MFEYYAKVERVIDGDTLEVIIDLGFTINITVHVRLLGVNTPEIFGAKAANSKVAGLASKAFVEQWVANTNSEVILTSYDAKKLSQEKYGRWLAVVKAKKDNSVINDLLISNGLAVKM
jgi:micrococcal nuclease